MKRIAYLFIIMGTLSINACAQNYPGLILTKAGVDKIKNSEYPPLFQQELDNSITIIDAALKEGIDVPIPKDMGGGYTHERHKKNYRMMQLSGVLYQLTKEDKYAVYVRDMLIEYAKIFKSLPIHPTDRSYSTGKIFWQCLNDANWLVYTSQAYDAVYNFISSKDRAYLEAELFRPYADFISVENPQFFNRVHNHSTWGNAAVGMIGLVMNDKELVDRALYGLSLDEVNELAKDNDGGFIYEKGKSKAGFFAQLDYAFSPDGFYTEGPYYQRYAMLPFMVFAQALENKRPDLKIFEYRNGLLIKAVKALAYQTNSIGEFFPINDAQKGMSMKASSVISAVNIAYGVSKDEDFLAATKLQGKVELDQNGFLISQMLVKMPDLTFAKSSIELKDGKDGDEGALGILRRGTGDKETTLVFKYTGQGLGHGHYDKLSYCYYDGPTEVMQDYGAARWVNIDQKAGGRYLKENNTWAKQTIAHNTLVVDQKSHFGGEYDIANLHHSDPVFFNTSNPKAHTVGAKEVNAYDGVKMNRILILWEDDYFENPVLIDYFSVDSKKNHSYDMPYQFAGQIMSQNFDYKTQIPTVMGNNHGYQHLYKEASATAKDVIQMNWFKDSKFYTITTQSTIGDEIILARIGANDPNFNLRRDALLIHRKENSKDARFLSVIENHGTYSRVTEVPLNPYPKIASVKISEDINKSVTLNIVSKDGNSWTLKVNKSNGEIKIEKQ